MEDVLDVYCRPYDARFPVVCLDETSKQLLGEVRSPLPMEAGKPERFDTHYQRHGVCNLFLCCEPLRGWRHVEVTARRTKIDFAALIRVMSDDQNSLLTTIRTPTWEGRRIGHASE
jgi:hypothetical protein